jgi:16S rRNA processing protein RimM
VVDTGEPVDDGTEQVTRRSAGAGSRPERPTPAPAVGGGCPPGRPAPTPVEAGRVGRAHGLDGSFYVTGARPRLLVDGGEVAIAGRTLRIVRRAGVEQRPIVRLSGIEDRTAAEALRGQPLMVTPADAPALGEREWWSHELKGCEVFDGERPVGTVAGLLELPSCEALEVVREAGPVLLVPMVRDAIREVDIAAARIDVNLDFLGEV